MNKLIGTAVHFLKNHSSAILSGGALIGTAATGYFAAKAGYRHACDIESEKDMYRDDAGRIVIPSGTEDPFTNLAVAKLVWRHYVPVGVCFLATAACVVGSNRIGNRKILAATMAYSLTDQAYTQFKEKVASELGEKKVQNFEDEIAAERVRKNPPLVIPNQADDRDVLCHEAHTGRYFWSTPEKLKQAENRLNKKLLAQDQCCLDEFYAFIGLKPTRYSSDLGWRSNSLMELDFTSVLMDDKRPVLSFDYSYLKPLYGHAFE